MSTNAVEMERLDGETAILTLNRPERRNALSIGMMDSLRGRLEHLAAELELRVAILRGAGPAFCSGLDLDEAAQVELAQRSAAGISQTYQALAQFPLVLIAAVHGAVYAGGVGLMASCDLIVAADDLRICLPEVRRGLVPALVATTLGGRLRDGERRELLLLVEPIDAARALGMGLVDRVVPAAQCLAEARSMAAAICKGGPHAIRLTKQWLRELKGGDRERQLARALELHNEARLQEEASEGLAAFREKRDPHWPPGIQ